MSRVLVMGASGRIGAYLRRVWPGLAVHAVWQYRANAPDGGFLWSPLCGPVPDCGPVDAVLCLSGGASGEGLAHTTDLALAALSAARRLGAGRVLLASSSAVYGTSPGPHDEAGPCQPASAYGAAKLGMEQAVLSQADALNVTCLRVGNVAGADALLGGLVPGRVPRLDRFADGRAPRRCYIGPLTLARVLAQLCGHPDRLPRVLNLAQPGLICMDSLLRAAGVPGSGNPRPPLRLPNWACGWTGCNGSCLLSQPHPMH